MPHPTVILLSTDDHTLGIQTVGTMVLKERGIDPVLAYLPSHLPRYPEAVEQQIIDVIAREIAQAPADVVIGLSLKELSLGRSMQLAKSLKVQFRDRATIVAGGSYASLAPEAIVDAVDHVMVGSGIGIIPILDAVAGGGRADPIVARPPREFQYPLFKEAWILGDDGRIRRGRTRPLAHPQYNRTPALEILAGSGCSYACSFCEVSALKEIFGKQYKIANSAPREIIELAANAVEADHVKYVYFFDEDFLLKPQSWIEEFATLYAARIALPFFIFATPASVIRSPARLHALAAAGLDTVNMGVQSASPQISVDLFGRDKDAGIMREAVHFLVDLHKTGKLSSPPMLDLIALNPYEEAHHVMQTLELLLTLPTPFETVVHCMSLFSGTALHTRALQEGKVPATYRFRYDLHDFKSRMRTNELKLDYSNPERLDWLHLNALLCGMRGVHTGQASWRQAGNFAEQEVRFEMRRRGNISLRGVLGLIGSLPDPMESSRYAWEQSLARINPVKEGLQAHASAAAA
jgi:hypothetical protein